MGRLQEAIAKLQEIDSLHRPSVDEVATIESMMPDLSVLYLAMKQSALARRRLTPGMALEIEAVLGDWWNQSHAARFAVAVWLDLLGKWDRADRDLRELVG